MYKPEMISNRLPALLAALALCTAGWTHMAGAEEAASEAAPATAEPAAETSPAAAPETAETPAAEAPAATASDTDIHAPVRHRYRDREFQNRRIAQIRAAAEQRRENMERWRSARRWWNNPVSENRRQWNKARSEWMRDMSEARRQYDEQLRPDYGYRYRYWRAYP